MSSSTSWREQQAPKQRAQSDKTMALRRILGDIKQLERERLVGVSAQPLEDDLLEWHVNVKAKDGPLSEVYIHCVMKFSEEYPMKPPSIKCLTPFGHRNVFGDFICLSMLEDKLGHYWKPYEKWSSAYSIVSILLQLQSFLTDEHAIYGATSSVVRRVKDFVCGTCRHRHSCPLPPVITTLVEDEGKSLGFDNEVYVAWIEIPQDVCCVMFSFLDSVSLHRASWTCEEWAFVVEKYNLKTRNEMICYHTKMDYHDCVLGFAISPSSGQANCPYKIHMDYLSDIAWDANVRNSVWGEEVSNWIPLIINNEHGTRAQSMLLSRLREIALNPADAITKLMNGIVIGLAKNVADAKSNYDGVLMSEKALIGYFALHHILLWLISRDERLMKRARARVQCFLEQHGEGYVRVPDLGEFLACLSCVNDVSWRDIQQTFIFEVWKRNVKWYVRTDRSLETPTERNCRKIFHETRVSRAIVGFQVFFVTEVCSSDGIGQMLKRYNEKLGRPSHRSIWKLHSFCESIRRMTSEPFETQYKFYWDSVKTKPPNLDFFVEYLKASVEASVVSGYYRRPSQVQRRPYNNVDERSRSGSYGGRQGSFSGRRRYGSESRERGFGARSRYGERGWRNYGGRY